VRLAFLAGTMTALGGCVSSPADQLASIQTLPPAHRTALQKTDRLEQADATNDQQSEIAAQAAEDVSQFNEPTTAVNDSNASDQSNVNSLVARRNIAATQNSIYSNSDPSTVTNSDDQQQVALNDANNGEMQPGKALNATQNSIFAGQPDQIARETAAIPLPDADKVGEVQDLALAGMDVPAEAQQVASADPANETVILRPNENQADESAANTRSLDTVPTDESVQPVAEEEKAQPKKRRLTLADFFRKKSSDTAAFDDNRFGHKKRVVTTAAIPNMQTAGLSDEALPGVNANAMMPVHGLADDEQSEGDDEPAGLMKLASLSGMARMAPNGLWTQTDKVEVRCLRPQLVSMLKQVEDHYKRPVVVTSGFRDLRHNRRVGGVRHSLHTLCAAADIQVEGVSKWQLADYLRSLPGRGGVGTYCHTSSVHIDIGGERDWNWRCRRRSRRG
jgi:uncharacterized protein YcbK (DUF882 family)